MNGLQKYVFSRTLEKAAWNNTTLLKGELTAEVRKLKLRPGPNIVIMGSGSIVAQLADIFDAVIARAVDLDDIETIASGDLAAVIANSTWRDGRAFLAVQGFRQDSSS